MLSKIPTEMRKANQFLIDQEILQTAIISLNGAANFYLQMAELTKDAILKEILFDTAKQEEQRAKKFNQFLQEKVIEFS